MYIVYCILIPLNGGHLSSEKVACESKRGHVEKPGSNTDLNTMQDMCKALPACTSFFKAKMLHKTCEGRRLGAKFSIIDSLQIHWSLLEHGRNLTLETHQHTPIGFFLRKHIHQVSPKKWSQDSIDELVGRPAGGFGHDFSQHLAMTWD